MKWNFVGLMLTVAGLFLFAFPVLIRSGGNSGSIQFGIVEVLMTAALTIALMGVHEGIHGLVMRGFGARPTFGAMLVGHVVPAFFATAVGHRFSRSQFVLIAAAPTVVISAVGFIACFGPWAGYLIVPLAILLGGGVGDGFAIRRALQEPPTTQCEDLRDGIRFYRADAPTAGLA